MRKSLMAATMVSALFAGNYAFAAVTTAAIKAVDPSAGTLTLADGSHYDLASTTDSERMLGGFLPGDVVTVVWDKVGTARSATSVSADFSAAVAGRIVAIDEGADSVKLDNGVVYAFDNPRQDRFDLSGFAVGDQVMIVAQKEGDRMIGRAMSASIADAASGTIAAIDAAAHAVVLQDGVTYLFDAKTDLSGFRVGDRVAITGTVAGNTHWGNLISAAKA